jgi:hypothetical protein
MTTVTVRPTTQAERDALVADKCPRFRYVCVDAVTDAYLYSFGILIEGAFSKAEAVFWAERWAGKNGARYVPPSGWEGIEGSLPEEPR